MVLALKYRPKKFSEVVGQEAVIQTLKNAIDNKKLANAYLFSGLRGSGKTSTARIFAKALQCEKGESSEPCEECENCKMANENRHIDIIEMDAASNRKIEDIKEIIEHTRYKPTIGRYKIFIIDEAHMLTKEAENALLKTLEEPPPYVKFILATTDPLKLPTTILSRTQHYRFTKIDKYLIKNHLEYILAKENINYEPKAIELIAKSGNGSLRDTLTILNQAIAYCKGNITLSQIVEMLGVINPEIIDNIFKIILENDKEKIKEIVKEISNYDIESILDEVIIYLKDALYTNKFALTSIERFFKIVADMKELIKINVDNEFVLSLMFFKMIEATKPHKIDDLIKEYEKEIFSQNTQTKPIQKTIAQQPIQLKTQLTPIDLFNKFLEKIKDRDKEIYECFKDVKFISFENKTITWESCVNEGCKTLLKKYWGSVLKLLLDETFGIGTKVTPQKCSKIVEEKEEKIENKQKEIEIPIQDKIIKKAQEIFADAITEINIFKEN
ncbi:MAG: DNA polymerase III subunit gamma/tau [Nautilia sp.]|nr:MAG: DNA polymerase III subunit gamma/tau [Nautilia sp.]